MNCSSDEIVIAHILDDLLFYRENKTVVTNAVSIK